MLSRHRVVCLSTLFPKMTVIPTPVPKSEHNLPRTPQFFRDSSTQSDFQSEGHRPSKNLQSVLEKHHGPVCDTVTLEVLNLFGMRLNLASFVEHQVGRYLDPKTRLLEP